MRTRQDCGNFLFYSLTHSPVTLQKEESTASGYPCDEVRPHYGKLHGNHAVGLFTLNKKIVPEIMPKAEFNLQYTMTQQSQKSNTNQLEDKKEFSGKILWYHLESSFLTLPTSSWFLTQFPLEVWISRTTSDKVCGVSPMIPFSPPMSLLPGLQM